MIRMSNITNNAGYLSAPVEAVNRALRDLRNTVCGAISLGGRASGLCGEGGNAKTAQPLCANAPDCSSAKLLCLRGSCAHLRGLSLGECRAASQRGLRGRRLQIAANAALISLTDGFAIGVYPGCEDMFMRAEKTATFNASALGGAVRTVPCTGTGGECRAGLEKSGAAGLYMAAAA